MSGGSICANPLRGEVVLRLGGREFLLRPTFAALVRAEQEAGPLFALVGQAAEGQLTLAALEAVLWHCLADRPQALDRASFGEALLAEGLAAALPAFRQLAVAILGGSAGQG